MWQRWPVAQSTGLLVLLVAACCAGRGAAAVTAPPTYPTPVPNRPKYPPAALPFSRRYDWRLAGVRDGAPLLPWRSFKVGRALGAEPAGGAVVYFPPGTYVLNRTITVTRPNVVLRGAGEANTTIYIPSSLTGVLGPRFHAPGGAQPKSAWAFVGGFITLSRLSSAARRRPLGKVPRGRSVRQFGRTIPVMSSSPFKVGDRVRVFVNDESTVGVCDHEGFCRRRLLHTGTAAHKGPAALRYATAAGVLTAYPNDPGMTPPWVPAQSDLVALPQMLAAGLGDEKAYGEDFEEETGGPAGAPPPPSSPNATTLPGRNATQPFEGVLWPAAAPGTIAAWLYGDGLARSGKGNFAVDKDTVTFTAKITLKNAITVTLDRRLPFPIKPSWRASVHLLVAPAQPAPLPLPAQCLVIPARFDRSQPHLEDRGYNALFLQGVRNCWVRNVRILDADNGIFMHSVDHSTIQDVLVNVTRPRTWTNLAAGPHHVSGHHPVSLLHGHHNLLSRVAVGTTYSHDITVGRATTSNVISQAAGFNLNLDHHRGGPFGNLFTDIDLGCGWRPFASSGLLENGDNSGRDEVFYNLRTTRARCPVTPKFPAPPTRVGWSTLPSCDFGPLISFVGNFSGRERCPDKKWLVISTTYRPHSAMSTQVALAGLGAMGRGIAARLAAFLSSEQAPEGYARELLVWNRSGGAATDLAAATPGCRAVPAARDLGAARLAFCCLANDEATEAVVGELLAAAGPAGDAAPRVLVNCATILPATVARLAAKAAEQGVQLLNMPVFGRPDAAAAGSLVAVPAGPAVARELLAPLLPAFAGRGVWDLGEDPSASAALKLVGNFWIVSQIEVAAQCLALAGKNGIEDAAVLRMMETFLASPIPLGYAKRISAGDYSTETGFAVDLALKDVGHMRTLARDSACPLPLADTAFNHLLSAKAKHGGTLDWGAIHLAVRDAAGLPPNSKDKSE
ncbi:3-hydroxyisobutyrate dehydrogenase family isoform B [Micractinium conductrix]|uniref:3-hydroxyisobutyrate dehydrogenase family isoform B n=1 Tax=Micractinium conductrix TaxID=554055 RepID=A0A2P6VRA2_9CHLO|nr:3-hydroxyisobutyrate dehydrogenase family isoform B [Micractinium conductrix]|eukprot:PSC76612.1 3-hydroxyisobutyrate dehydrogenase family isoform B [Micractinium conductrix]